MDYKSKYLKYKNKYLNLKNLFMSKNPNQNPILSGGGKKLKKNKSKKIITYNLSRMNIPEPNYTFNVSEPWFSLILLKLKSVEGRLNRGRFEQIKPGDIVKWTNKDFGFEREVITQIQSKIHYKSFREYLESEGLDKCLPGFDDIEKGISVYYTYYNDKDEIKHGVVAIRLEVL
jgi:ASC-1-like (ASCH) protein